MSQRWRATCNASQSIFVVQPARNCLCDAGYLQDTALSRIHQCHWCTVSKKGCMHSLHKQEESSLVNKYVLYVPPP